MSEKKVSIIIPAHNAEEYILRAVSSAINQTYKNVEVIVVNDGSTDKTEEIVKSVSDERVRIFNVENSGVSRARNVGLDEATGEYITFMDSDDALTNDAVELLVKALEESGAEVCLGNQIKLPHNAQAYEESIGNGEMRKLSGEKALSYSLMDHPIGYSCLANLYKKELVEDIRFIEGKDIHEDSYFMFLCFCKKPEVVILKKQLYNYFCTSCSLSRSHFSEKYLAILYYAEKKEEIIRELFPEHLDKIPNLHIKARVSLLHNLCKTYDKRYRIYEKECIRYIIKNKKMFHPVSNSEKKFFKIITRRMFWIYKLLYNIKNKKKS